MDTLECPYCQHDNSAPDDCYEQDTLYETECRECDKVFMFNISYIPYYEGYKADCLNGSQHEFMWIFGQPRFHFVNQRTCRMCDKKNGLDWIADKYPDAKVQKEVPENGNLSEIYKEALNNPQWMTKEQLAKFKK